MLTIKVPGGRFWNEDTQEFIYTKAQTLVLEHSLLSLSKWESKYHKPFLSEKQKTNDELIDYIRFMTINKVEDDLVYLVLGEENLLKIKEYIDDPMTATWFSDANKRSPKKRVVTAELVYYWIFSLGINKECEKWHFNRLITLIKVFEAENEAASGKNKLKGKALYDRNSAISKANRARMRKH